jgi:hypothetical protein
MSWIKENKFLAGFAGATLVGAGALSFLLLQAKGRYEANLTTYETDSADLTRLQNQAPFPNEANVRALDDQKKAQAEAIAQLQQSLAKIELPLEQVTPQQFQDRLRTTVDGINQKANEAGVQRAPETANLGFDRYLSEPPRPEAAAALARQLRAIEIIVGNLIKNRVASINTITREEVAEERANRGDAEAASPQGGKAGGRDKGGKSLVDRTTVTVVFLADQRSSIYVLNEIVSSKDQFFIPRLVSFKNEKDQGPAKNDPSAAAAGALPGVAPAPLPGAVPPAPTPEAAPGAPGAPATPGVTAAAPPQQRIIVGEEKVEVTMRIEIADFADAAPTASK